MTYVIAEPCRGIKDASCVAACPVDCIHTSAEADSFYINPDECIDCGLCLNVCPVEAIFPEGDLPATWGHYGEINAQFFNSPKGESRKGESRIKTG
jgi:ferredoxin